MGNLSIYLPQDRLRALARGELLPDRAVGSALFADISGFTSLTETLSMKLGTRRGAEELTHHIEAVYTALIAQVEKYSGSVISFAGDAITCWFDEVQGAAVSRAVRCAFALQQAMQAFATISLPDSSTTTLSLKVAVASGSARRFLVGDSVIHYLDTLAGTPVERTAIGEHLANRGEILLDEATLQAVKAVVAVQEWRVDVESRERFAVVNQLTIIDQPTAVNKAESPITDSMILRPFLLPAVYEREITGQAPFLTEFRPGTVLFVRFQGIDYDADDAEEQLDSFIRTLQSIVSRYEGSLLQLTIGDKGSYAYVNFGALITHEDDNRRAVKTALALQDSTELQLQIGITRGLMRVGAYGGTTRKTYGALGDDVNLAARLMTTAVPGEILVSEHVHKTIQNDFIFELRPSLILKGKSQPLTAFAIISQRQHRAVRLQEPNFALPMVGREAEMRHILDKLALTIKGKAQVIGIVAEAGIGKSRLVSEVIREAHQQGFIGYGGACQSDGIDTPYLVWKSIWQAFFEIDPHMSAPELTQWLEDKLTDLAPNRLQALPLLSILLNVDIPDNAFTQSLEPKYKQSTLQALLEDCLRVAAQTAPLLIVIEDLHWIDALSFHLLQELEKALADSPICFLLAYRPLQSAHLEISHLEDLARFSQIELHELNQAESAQVVLAKLGQLYPTYNGAIPTKLVEELTLRAQGNPFYLEELLNYLRDQDLNLLEFSDLDKIDLPNSLHTLVLSRLDRLSEQDKTMLRVASVVGRLFRLKWLNGYYPGLGNMNHVQAGLERLADMDITSLDSPEPELAYIFKHIITHEVTYESLPFATRARLHEQFAHYLEVMTGRQRTISLLDTIAHHYGQSDNTPKKREYFQKAAEAAWSASALTTAVTYFYRLLAITPHDDPEYTTLALQLAEAYRLSSDFPAALTTIEQAQTAAQTDADRASALALLGEITAELGSYAQAVTLLKEAILLAQASDDKLALCRVLLALGGSYGRLGELGEAWTALTDSAALARELGDVSRELLALMRLGLILGAQGDVTGKERLLHEVYTRATAVGNRYQAMIALNNLSVAADERNDLTLSQEYGRQMLTLAREIGAQQYIALCLTNLADSDIKLGQFETARAGLREGLDLALRLGVLPFVVIAIKNFGFLAYAEGQSERALNLLGMASQHPAWSSDDQQYLDMALAEWELASSLVQAELARGITLDWDTTIQELLKE